ncbi:MAG: prepilin-type N-terminal cleavage/methylation domain-containing protein [Lentisphaeria bacterium]|nr:prepilin-type N-terminal cleavage/methylation domain-containing protein [Lentisphaeria bacterium]
MLVRRQNDSFTLIEVVVAATILGLAVSMTLGIIGAARARVLRAEQRWGKAHLTSQAAELFLLGGPQADKPPNLLPEGFDAMCEIVEVEDVPVEAQEPMRDWALGAFRIRVTEPSGSLLSEVIVQSVVREDDLE